MGLACKEFLHHVAPLISNQERDLLRYATVLLSLLLSDRPDMGKRKDNKYSFEKDLSTERLEQLDQLCTCLFYLQVISKNIVKEFLFSD